MVPPLVVALVALAACQACAGSGAGDLGCVPAATAGPSGQLPALDSVPKGESVSAVVVWPSGVPRDAERVVRAAGGTVAHEFRAQPALLVSATGAQLRRLRGARPDAAVTLGAAGTTEICLVAAYSPAPEARAAELTRRARALARRVLGRE
jgi:hypothetical protein